jgi:methyl-accepting chemotaxis protein
MVDIQNAGDQHKSHNAKTKPKSETISLLLGEDVSPKVEQALSTLRGLRKTIDDLNAATQMISSLPFINIPEIAQGVQSLSDLFRDLDDGVDRMSAQVENFKTGLSEVVIEPIQDQATEMEEQLAEARSEIQAVHSDVKTTLRVVVAVRPQIPAIVDAISLFLTVQLLWGALAQAALIYLAWIYLKIGRLDLHNLLAATDLSERSTATS